MQTSKEQRFQVLFDRHHRQIYSYCRRRLDEESARDCASETFLVAWRRLDRVPADDRALPWLYAVARRVVANRFRSRRRFRDLITRLGGLAPESNPGPESLALSHDEHRQALEALSRLRSQDQELLRLSVWEELSHREIGEVLGCSAHAVDQRKRRATERLSRELNRTGHRQKMRATPNPLKGEERT